MIIFWPSDWDSSVNIVSDYGLGDRMNWFRFPTETKGSFSSLCVQTSSEAHPDSYPMGTGVSSRR
jgi:hypothetical protein